MARSGADTDDEKYKAPALAKGLDILEELASASDGLTQVELAKALRRTSSEIFRMLVVLTQRGYVGLSDGDRYYLTTKMFEVAHRHPPIARLTSIAGQSMQKLANRINQSVHLCILNEGKLLVIAQVDCADNNLASVRLGAQIPIYDSASGRVLAAFMDDDERGHLVALAGDEPKDRREKFIADLSVVRQVGYCEGESLTLQGVINLSAPVFDYTGRAVAAVTMSYIRRLTQNSASVAAARDDLVSTCKDLSGRMGAGAAPKSVR